MKNPYASKLPFALMIALTLGLTPFYPEPHIVGKLRWIFGGANGMKLIDYGDLLMHGLPWVFLFYILFRYFTYKNSLKNG